MLSTGRAFLFSRSACVLLGLLLTFLLPSVISSVGFAAISTRSAFAPVSVLAPDPATTMRVRLGPVHDTVTITGQSMRFAGLSLPGYRAIRLSWKLQRRGVNLWRAEDRDTHQVLSESEANSFSLSGDGLRVNLRQVSGALTFVATPRRTEASMIAAIDLETYVRGVLPSEMPKGWPLSALRAQAVAARTYALFRKRERTKARALFDVEADVNDQVFALPGFEEGADAALANVEQAVRETKGVVLAKTDARGHHPQLVAAYYHADCGGRTEDARLIWGRGSQTLGTAVDDGCPLNPSAKWKVSFSAREVALRILGPGHGSIVALADFQTVGITGSGRVDQVRLVWTDGGASVLPAHEFRMAMGHDRVKSTNFKWSRGPNLEGVDAYTLEGRGSGHGVGMCQWGARAMALNGQPYEAILKHYYPQATLASLK